MQLSKKVAKATIMFGLVFMLAAPVMAGNGYGPGDGTGTGDGPQDGTGNGPGDCTTAISQVDSTQFLAGNGKGHGGGADGGNQGSGDNGGYGPGDGTGTGDGPEDGTGYGPGTGDCVNS